MTDPERAKEAIFACAFRVQPFLGDGPGSQSLRRARSQSAAIRCNWKGTQEPERPVRIAATYPSATVYNKVMIACVQGEACTGVGKAFSANVYIRYSARTLKEPKTLNERTGAMRTYE